jgi:predicted AAA+ superfamily ATPase
LFGPRGVGKSTYLEHWAKDKSVTTVDLLDPITYQRYSTHPELLISDWKAKPTNWIFVDEIQKIPALLDVIQKQMRQGKVHFALTGSSARKLRRGASNLLGGRAFEFHMHPLTHVELQASAEGFELHSVLSWGSLPHLINSPNSSKIRSLYSYVTTYLKEEILVEQVIRKIEPFQKFLEVAAQMNGKILNFAKISRDSGVEERSVARYFQILDDTLIGFHLYPYEKSIRKQQSKKAKFYFFDTGITRTLQNQVTLELQPQSNIYGDLFEQFIILEMIRLNDYYEKHYRFYYFRSKDDVEVDLVIERPGLPDVLVEIKAKDFFDNDDSKSLINIGAAFVKKEMYVLSNCPTATLVQDVYFCHWQEGIQRIFQIENKSPTNF